MTIYYVCTASVNLCSSILVLCRFGVICFLICKSFMKIKKFCSQDLKQNHYTCLPFHMRVSCLQTKDIVFTHQRQLKSGGISL